MLVGEKELDEVMDQTLGSLRGLVDERSIAIDPGSPACYLRLSLATSARSQFGLSCRLAACSVLLHREKSIALRGFDANGCDAIFDGLGLARHFPSTYVDASSRIRTQCGSDDFAIDTITVELDPTGPRLRISFRSILRR